MHIHYPPHASLHAAIAAGDLAGIGRLLREGADPNARDEAGRSAFLAFCNQAHRWSSTELVDHLRMFLYRGADPSLPEKEGFTAWHSLLVRRADIFHVWLPEVLRNEADIDAWFTEPPEHGGRKLEALHTFIPFGCRKQFDHDLSALRAWMQKKLLQREVPVASAPVSPRRI